MENAVLVHVVNGLEHLVNVELDPLLSQIVLLTFDGFIHVHVHQLKHQGQPASWFIVEHLQEVDYVGVGAQPLQGLDFP